MWAHIKTLTLSYLTIKTLALSQLVKEVVDQLSKRFVPRVSDIKTQIDWLIDHDYLGRGETRTVLNYLA